MVGDDQTQPETDFFEIVVVCTGNRARSPLVEAFLHQLTRGMPVEVTSAGTLDVGAAGVLPTALSAAGRWGIDLSEHKACYVRGSDLAGVDLVVGFELSHVSVAVVECGAPRQRTFTLPEAVELLEQVPPSDVPRVVDRARARLELAHDARAGHAARQIPEIADPLHANQRQFDATAAVLRDLSYRLVAGLFGQPLTRT